MMRDFFDGPGVLWAALALVIVLTALTIFLLRAQPMGI